MIVEFFWVWVVAPSIIFIAGLFPQYDPADFQAFESDSTLASILEAVVGIGTWVDIVALLGIFTALLAVYAVGFGIRLVRVLIGHIPAIGGNG